MSPDASPDSASHPTKTGARDDASAGVRAETIAGGDTLAQWAATFRTSTDGAVLPAHSAQCVGCGPDNPHGLHLVVRRVGDAVVCTHTFDARHVGAPGVAHGGAVATAFDDLCGFLLYLVGELAVTRNLSVDYLAPVRLTVPYELRASYGQRSGRRLPVTATMTRIDDRTVAATASATFIVVDIDHFHRAAQTTTTPASTPAADQTGLYAAVQRPDGTTRAPITQQADQS